MLAYIYAFFFILFQQSLHTISLERGLIFMYYLLDETQEAYISYMHVFNLQRFLKESGFIQEMNFLMKVWTFLPSIFTTGVHPPSPKFPM